MGARIGKVRDGGGGGGERVQDGMSRKGMVREEGGRGDGRGKDGARGNNRVFVVCGVVFWLAFLGWGGFVNLNRVYALKTTGHGEQVMWTEKNGQVVTLPVKYMRSNQMLFVEQKELFRLWCFTDANSRMETG